MIHRWKNYKKSKEMIITKNWTVVLSFNTYLLSTCNVPVTVLGTGATKVNEIRKYAHP